MKTRSLRAVSFCAFLIATLSACGDEGVPCDASVNCHNDANDESVCDEGYEWLDASSSTDFSCVETPDPCGIGVCEAGETSANCVADCPVI